MNLGLVSIQRNRASWITEWLAFHHLVGFTQFYFYAHLCTDGSLEVLRRLQSHFDLTVFALDFQQDQIQLGAYQHACENFMGQVDWMGFIDGDEFIYPTRCNSLQDALLPYQVEGVSAVGVYNRNFGSSGHQTEPQGLITDNYRMRAPDSYLSNRRVKSIVRGRQPVQVSLCSNVFVTPAATVDELMRPVTWGYMPDYEPSYETLCFNHYVCQSREYFLNFKRHSGHADANSSMERDEAWWQGFDTNDVLDHSLQRFSEPLREMVAELQSKYALPVGGMPVPGHLA